MHIEMIDLLRCVNAHEDSWLVASFRGITNRIVIDGTLGCPICSAEYEIRNGVPDFTRGESITDAENERSAVSHKREELATRAGAYLDAAQAGTTIVLGGQWAYAAQELADMTDLRVIALNAPPGVEESDRVGLVRVAHAIPLASGSVHGAALDAWFDKRVIAEAARITRAGGRIVGATSFPAPTTSVVLAHDDHYWVAENPLEIVSLKRSST